GMKVRLPRTTSYDLWLALVVLALTLIGIAMVYSASGMRALDTVDDPRYYLGWQTLWAVLGLGGMVAAMRIDYHRYRGMVVPRLAVVVLLLVVVLIPGIGVRAGGAARWLRLGAFGLQPAELAKLALILYLAAWFCARRDEIRRPDVLQPFLAATGTPVGLVVAEPDFGT